jgi:hypothetical protein
MLLRCTQIASGTLSGRALLWPTIVATLAAVAPSSAHPKTPSAGRHLLDGGHGLRGRPAKGESCGHCYWVAFA